MADQLSRGTLFDPMLVTDLINKVKGHSSLAKLSNQQAIPFNGLKEFTFTLDADVDIVAENGKKTHGGASLEPVTIVPIKIEYGARVSDEFVYASEEAKIDILKSFNEGFANKVARGIDIMAFHGVNPRTKQESAVIGDNCFDKAVTQTVNFTISDPDTNVEDAVKMIQGADNIVSGMAIDTTFASALASMKNSANERLYPELAWGANPGAINGLPVDVNTTVGLNVGTNKDVAIVGDFANMVKWGYAKQIPLEVIRYGDPDNSGKDLKGYNQVYLRAEIYLGWGILDKNSFARVVKAGQCMEYINVKTGASIITENAISGGDWVPADQVTKVDSQEAADNQGDLTVAQIKARLDELGVEYDKGAKKADLLALLEQHEGQLK